MKSETGGIWSYNSQKDKYFRVHPMSELGDLNHADKCGYKFVALVPNKEEKFSKDSDYFKMTENKFTIFYKKKNWLERLLGL
jgi:hypothetical protein